MAYAYATTTGNGVTKTVAVPFPYISKAHIHIYLNGVEVTQSTFSWLSASSIELPTAPANGVNIKVQRVTPADTILSVYSSPNVLDHRDLNSSLRQLLYICQEAFDYAFDAGALIGSIADYLAQITDMFNQIQDWFNALSAFAVYQDYIASIPYTQDVEGILADFPIVEDLVLDAGAAARFSCFTPTPPSGDTEVYVLHVNKTTGSVIQNLGSFTIGTDDYAGAWVQAVSAGYVVTAGSILRFLSHAVHASMTGSTYSASLHKVTVAP